jgi:pimeloyl-ACP methyl ester carboxylesterase
LSQNIIRMLTPQRYYSEKYFMDIAPSLFGGRVARDRCALQELFADRSKRVPSSCGYIGQLCSILAWTSLPWLWQLRQPTLVLAGADDRLVPVANAHILIATIPDARLHLVPDGGHLFLMDQAADVAPVISQFLLEAHL